MKQTAYLGLVLTLMFSATLLPSNALAEETWQPYDTTSGTYQLVPSNQAPVGAAPLTSPYDNPPAYNPAVAMQNPKAKVPWWKFWYKAPPPIPVEKHTQIGARELPAKPYALLRIGRPLSLGQQGITLPTGFYMLEPLPEKVSNAPLPQFVESQANNVAQPRTSLDLAIKRAGSQVAVLPVLLTTTTANQPVQAMTAKQVTKQPLAVKQETEPLRQASLVQNPQTGAWVLRYQLQAWVYESAPLW